MKKTKRPLPSDWLLSLMNKYNIPEELAVCLILVFNRIIFVPQSVDLIILLSSPSYDLVNAIVCFLLWLFLLPYFWIYIGWCRQLFFPLIFILYLWQLQLQDFYVFIFLFLVSLNKFFKFLSRYVRLWG